MKTIRYQLNSEIVYALSYIDMKPFKHVFIQNIKNTSTIKWLHIATIDYVNHFSK